MPTPEKSLLEEFEERRSAQDLLFQGVRDATAQEEWILEYVSKQGAAVHLFPRSTKRDPQGSLESSGVDPLYGDIIDPEYQDLEQRLDTRAVVDHKPTKQQLKKFGVQEVRDVVFWFPLVLLENLGLVTSDRFRGVNIGDLVVWDGTWYIIENAHRNHYFGQSDKFFWTGAFCNRYHHNSSAGESPPSEFRVT